jgi:hypothetical protein
LFVSVNSGLVTGGRSVITPVALVRHFSRRDAARQEINCIRDYECISSHACKGFIIKKYLNRVAAGRQKGFEADAF